MSPGTGRSRRHVVRHSRKATVAPATMVATRSHENSELDASMTQKDETKEKSPKKVTFSEDLENQETDDELNDQWFNEMKEISLRKEALLQNQLEVAAENQRLMQEMIAEQRHLRAAQEATQASHEKLRKEQAEATKKLNKISSTLEAILLDSRQQQADKENDPGIEAEKPKRTEREMKEKQPKVNAATVPPIEEIVCYRCTEVGHYSTSCPLVKQGLWYCYVCNAIKRHNSKNCPNKCQEYVQNNSDSNNKTNPKGRNMRGAGRGRGRSSFRGKRFTPYSKRPKAHQADIAYAVNLLSRRQVAPTVGDFQEVKRILRYLRGTINEGLVYRANESDMEVFTDSSFGDCESSKATSGVAQRRFN
ncbi:unnamed protein product [Trichogramma brassicae]|uniref:CCHC-type domain-containing protein n=1 Tax=Trichogramma brassicae TaxID=86971 RepID=A0A6H5J3E3_9HYME|nr:unnamed protein product [Trichogramma brassicae]